MDDAASQQIDIRPALRDDIAEYLWFVRTHADIAERWLTVPDDPAAEYAVARMISYVKLAASSMRALRNVDRQICRPSEAVDESA